jgi:hypothetical protein
MRATCPRPFSGATATQSAALASGAVITLYHEPRRRQLCAPFRLSLWDLAIRLALLDDPLGQAIRHQVVAVELEGKSASPFGQAA